MPTARKSSSRFVDVDLRHVSLERGGRQILCDISWRVRPGERWVVIGSNGSGKTQLLKILAGVVWPSPDERHSLRWRWRGEWRASPQELLREIAYLGPERQDRYERYSWNHSVREVVGTGVHRSDIPLQALGAADRRVVTQVLRHFRLTRLAARPFLTLSYGERRRVLLARVVAGRPGLILLDELLTGLDTVQRCAMLDWLAASIRSKRPWVLTTHRVTDVPGVTTHALVLTDGRVSYCGPMANVNLADHFAARTVSPSTASPGLIRGMAIHNRLRSPSWFRFRDASIHLDYRPIVQALNWEVRGGECWIIRGANGAGKSTLLRTIYGDHAVAAGGSIERRGILPGVPLMEFKQHCGFVAPHLQSDYPRDAKVLDVVVSGLHSSIGLNEPSSDRERGHGKRALRRVGAASVSARRFGDLSYGEARRVLFARALVRRPGLLLLDEAFAGLDTTTRHELLELVDASIACGGAVVLATHHSEEVPRLASHELHLRAGRAESVTPTREPLRSGMT